MNISSNGNYMLHILLVILRREIFHSFAEGL